MNHCRRRILSLVDQYAQEQLDFLIQLCNQNSYSYNKEGVEKIATMVIDHLGDILPFHEVFRQDHFGDHHLLKNHKSDRAIYLVGHMDTIFPQDHPFQRCTLKGKRLKGPGSGDMKGGLVIFTYAIKIMNQVGFLNQLPLTFILNSDEEIGSVSSKSIFLKERKKARLCLVAECAGLNNEIVVSRNGKICIQITSHGQAQHVGSVCGSKSSAILELCHHIIDLENLNTCYPNVFVNVGKITGGIGSNSVPDTASCLVDIRWQNEMQKDEVMNRIKEKLNKSIQTDCSSEFEILNHRPCMPENENTLDLVRLIQQIGNSLNQEILTEHRSGTSDANFFGVSNIPTLDGFGPICDKDHSPEEYILVPSLKERTAVLTIFLWRYGIKTGLIKNKNNKDFFL